MTPELAVCAGPPRDILPVAILVGGGLYPLGAVRVVQPTQADPGGRRGPEARERVVVLAFGA